MIRRLEYRLFEFCVLKQFHLSGSPVPASFLASRKPWSAPKSNRDKGFSESRRRSNAVGFLANSSPMAPSSARTRGGSVSTTLSRRSYQPARDRPYPSWDHPCSTSIPFTRSSLLTPVLQPGQLSWHVLQSQAPVWAQVSQLFLEVHAYPATCSTHGRSFPSPD